MPRDEPKMVDEANVGPRSLDKARVRERERHEVSADYSEDRLGDREIRVVQPPGQAAAMLDEVHRVEVVLEKVRHIDRVETVKVVPFLLEDIAQGSGRDVLGGADRRCRGTRGLGTSGASSRENDGRDRGTCEAGPDHRLGSQSHDNSPLVKPPPWRLVPVMALRRGSGRGGWGHFRGFA